MVKMVGGVLSGEMLMFVVLCVWIVIVVCEMVVWVLLVGVCVGVY